MIPSPGTSFHQLLSDTLTLLPQFERRALLETNLVRNIGLALGLDRRAGIETIAETLGRYISDLASPSTLDAEALQRIGRAAKYLPPVLQMAEAGVVWVPGVELAHRYGDVIFPNGRALLHFATSYESDCPESASFHFDPGSGGLLTIPGYVITELGATLLTAEGRMLIPVRLGTHSLGSYFQWGVIELPSTYAPNGHTFVFEGRQISCVYGLYPLSTGRIVAFVRLHTENPNEYDNQLIDIAQNELLTFEESGTYIAGNLVYGTEGELFAPIRFKGVHAETMITHHGNMLDCHDTIGQQIADVVSREILTAGIHTSDPWINADGSVQVRVWRNTLTEKGLEDECAHLQTLSNPRVNSIDPFNDDNFPLGAVKARGEMGAKPHVCLAPAKPQWVELKTVPIPENHLTVAFRERWIVTHGESEQRPLSEMGEFLPAPDSKPGSGWIKYIFTNAGDQIVEFCRHNDRKRENEYTYFDLRTGKQLRIDGRLVVGSSTPRVLPDGREIWPLELKGEGYFVLDPQSRKLTGIPGIKLVYINGSHALIDDCDQYYIYVCCKPEFNDQRFLKV